MGRFASLVGGSWSILGFLFPLAAHAGLAGLDQGLCEHLLSDMRNVSANNSIDPLDLASADTNSAAGTISSTHFNNSIDAFSPLLPRRLRGPGFWAGKTVLAISENFDALRALQTADQSVDVVVGFHSAFSRRGQPALPLNQAMGDIARVLRPNGVAILAPIDGQSLTSVMLMANTSSARRLFVSHIIDLGAGVFSVILHKWDR